MTGIGKLMDNHGTIYVGLANGGLLALPRLLLALPQDRQLGLKVTMQPRRQALPQIRGTRPHWVNDPSPQGC